MAQVGLKLSQVGFKLLQVGFKLASSWLQVGRCFPFFLCPGDGKQLPADWSCCRAAPKEELMKFKHRCSGEVKSRPGFGPDLEGFFELEMASNGFKWLQDGFKWLQDGFKWLQHVKK